MYGPLLELEMFKKCTPLWREAHFQVKMYKAPHVRTTFGSWHVEKVHAVVAQANFQVKRLKTSHVRTTFDGSDLVLCGRRKGLWTLPKVSKTWGFWSSFNNNHQDTTLHNITLNYITLHYTALHYTTLHYTALHCTALHYTTLDPTTLHSTTLHSTTLHYTTLNCTTLHYTYNYNHNYATLH